jgi:tetratricopeptide (TPR) repeat protein
VDACDLDSMTDGTADGLPGALPEALRAVDPGDCVTCHMPLRRTEDVVHVTMTDHRIRRTPGDPKELLAPLEEKDPDIVDVFLADEARAPEGNLGEIYRAVAVLRTGARFPDAADYLETILDRDLPDAIVPRLDLAEAQLGLQRWEQAEATLRGILEREPDQDQAQARQWLAVALAGQGKPAAAEAVLRGLLADGGDRPEAEYNLGRILLGRDRPEAALRHLRRAAELRPTLAAAWLHMGRAHLELEQPAEAEDALRRSLAIDPTEARGYVALAEALRARGDEAEALRTLRHGVKAAADPAPVRRALESGAEPSP